MPARVQRKAEKAGPIRQIVASSSDVEFLDHLIDGMRTTDQSDLLHSLEKLSNDRDADIEHICSSNHEEFVNSVNKLDQGRGDCTSLGTEILHLVQSYQSSTDNLAAQKKSLVDSQSVRQHIDESSEALKECLEILRLSNQVHDLVGKQNHYAALRALDELQNTLQARESEKYKIGDLIEKSIPATQKMIAEAVMTDLNTWLYRIRDISQYVGEVAFFYTEQRRTRQKERAAKDQFLGTFKLNSPIELVADEMEEYDVLNNEEANVHVDFTPLFECIHIHEALGQTSHFRTEYAVTRRKQRDLIIPSTLKLDDEDGAQLKTLLENITGFSIIERAILKKTENLRTQADIDELWDSLCQSAINLISSSIQSITSAETLLQVTSTVSLFIQTIESFQFYSATLNRFLMTLFENYTQVLKRRCSDDFQEIVSGDDYMPMPISNIDEYDKIIDVGWYTPEKDREEVTFPCVLPFSQMYPMCCIDIRNFLNQVYSAPDDYLPRSSAIDETIKNSIDELLCERICQPLIEYLSSQYPGQIVQILTNLEHFEQACLALQEELAEFRTSRSKSAPIVLKATNEFKLGKKQAEKRIFDLVNSKIRDLIETAEYNWSTTKTVNEPSNYVTELTRYLNNIMGSALMRLPSDIKDLIYLDSLAYAAAGILSLPLDPTVTSITPAALHLLELDVSHLSNFVSSLSLPSSATYQPFATVSPSNALATTPKDYAAILRKNLEELNQSVALMSAENPDEFYDITQRDKKFGSVNAQNGALLLDKAEKGKAEATNSTAVSQTFRGYGDRFEETRAKAGERFGNVMRGLRRGGDGSERWNFQ